MIVSCNNLSLLSIFSISFEAHAPEVFEEHANAVVLRRENRNITSCERCLSIYACFEGLLEMLLNSSCNRKFLYVALDWMLSALLQMNDLKYFNDDTFLR